MPAIEKISIKEKLGFALGDTACNLYFVTFMTFMPIFYTDIFGVSAAAMGTMFLVTKIWDAVNDPMMGVLADRSNTRWGKYRPFLLYGSLPLAIAGVLTFTTPDLTDSGKLIYAYITYTLVMMLYTLVNVPYAALMGVMTPDTKDRTTISSFRFVGVFAGQLIALTAVTKLPKYLGGEGVANAKGYQITIILLSILAAILLYITFFSTKERVHPPKGQRNPIGQDIKDLIGNAPWLMIGIATFFQLFFVSLPGGVRTYYFKYFVSNGDVALFGIHLKNGWSEDNLLLAYMVSGTLCTILGVIATKFISRIFGKAFTYWGSLLVAIIVTALNYFLKNDDLNLIFVINLVRSFVVGPVSAMQWAMYADCADYNEWKTGRRSTALIMAASLFALKFGLAIGAAVIGWALEAYGYVGKTIGADGVEIPAPETQSPEAIKGIIMLMSLIPAIIGLFAVGAMVLYPLSTKKMSEIEDDLMARRKQEEESQ
ncbi:MAG: MFS transporter [Sedimentisphaerales bacterium]|nr:MFS transporter [Sedimentisphaerales bacterium]